MIGHMHAGVGTTVTLLACVALAGCSSDPGSPSPGQGTRQPGPTPSSVAAVPRQPHVTRQVPVQLRAGLSVMSDDPCTPDGTRRVCSADGTRAWAPLADPAPATLVEASTRLTAGHTSWTTTLRFSPASRAALARTAREAAGAGGVVLVVARGRVLADVPPPLVHGAEAVVTGLDKPAAWDMVTAFDRP